MSPARKRRARIMLLADEGVPNAVIATRLRVTRNTVRHWRARFARRGLAGLESLPKPGRPSAKDRAIRTLPAAIETTAEAVAKQRQQSSRADPHRKPRPRTANLAALAKLLPPGRPACFDSDAVWQDFIQHAAVSGRRDHADGPVIWLQGGAPALNRDFSYCEDCTAARQARMQGENRCLPNFLRFGGSMYTSAEPVHVGGTCTRTAGFIDTSATGEAHGSLPHPRNRRAGQGHPLKGSET